jgi:hypothetical protein
MWTTSYVESSEGWPQTAIAVASNANPSLAGTVVVLTATVTGFDPGTPRDTITFKDGANALGTGT